MAAPAAYTLRELLKDASKHALPVGPDSAATAARVHELLEAARTHSDAAPAGKPGLQNPAPLPNTLLRVETLAKAVEALGLIVASRVSLRCGCSRDNGLAASAAWALRPRPAPLLGPRWRSTRAGPQAWVERARAEAVPLAPGLGSALPPGGPQRHERETIACRCSRLLSRAGLDGNSAVQTTAPVHAAWPAASPWHSGARASASRAEAVPPSGARNPAPRPAASCPRS